MRIIPSERFHSVNQGRVVVRGTAAGSFTHVMLAGALLMLASAGGFAQSLYWDINGSTTGSGGPSPSGTWDGITPNWNANSAGTGTTGDWVSGDTANFSAGSDATGAYTVTLNGTQTAAGVSFKNGTNTLTGGTLNLIGSGAVSVSASQGIIASPITGSVGLTKTSVGELVLQGANTFTGNLTNKAGTITLDNNQAAGNGSIVLNPSSLVILHSSQSLTTLTNNISMSGSVSTIEANADQGNTLVLSGLITGSHNWSAGGQGTLELAGSVPNTFAGVLTVAQGTLVVAGDGALGNTVNGAVVNSGATLAFEGGFEYTANKQITLNGTGAGGGAIMGNVGGDNIFDGTTVLATNSSIGAQSGSSLTLVGPLTGGFSITKVGGGTLILASSGNTYGNTLVNQGALYVQDAGTAGSGLVTVSSGAVLAGVSSSGNPIPAGVNLSGTIVAGDNGFVPATVHFPVF